MKIFCPIKIERPNFLFLFFLHTKFLSKIDESKRVKILIPIYCFDKLLKKERKKRYDKHLNPTIKYNSPRDEAWPKITFTDFAIYPRDFGFRTYNTLAIIAFKAHRPILGFINTDLLKNSKGRVSHPFVTFHNRGG